MLTHLKKILRIFINTSMSKLKIKLVSFLLAFVFCTFSYAEPITDSEKYGLKWTNMPIVCSSLDNIQRYLDDYEFVIDKLGVGRENAKAEGEPVYTIATYQNSDKQMVAVLMVPGVFGEVCMIYRVFDTVFYDENGELLNEESKD